MRYTNKAAFLSPWKGGLSSSKIIADTFFSVYLRVPVRWTETHTIAQFTSKKLIM